MSAFFFGSTELRERPGRRMGWLAGLVCCVNVAAAAEEAAPTRASPGALEEVVVTAQKRAENLKDVPMSIMALQGDDLDTQLVMNLQDLALAVPGLATWDAGGYGFRQMYMRGVGNIRGTSSIIGVYVDDASVVSVNGAQLDLRIYDLERIEVLRGPQGTLYGDGSMGGTLRFITRDPNLEAFGGKAELVSAFTEDGSPTQTVRGVLNAPIVKDVLGVRVSATYEDKGGWIDQAELGKEDINDGELINVRAKVLWEPTERFRATGTAIVHRNDAGALDTGEESPGASYRQVLGRATTPSGQHDYDLYNLTLNYDFGPVNLVSASGYIDHFNRFLEYGYRVPLVGPREEFPPLDVMLGLGGGWDRHLKVVTQEVRLSSSTDGRANWTVGAFYRDADTREVGVGAFGAFPLVTDSTIESKAWTAFGQVAFAVTDRLELGVGASYFEDDRREANILTNIEGQRRFSSTNPRLFASLDVTPSIKVYASGAKGFRSGGFNVATAAAGYPPYAPDKILSYELGTKMSLRQGRVAFETALFYSDYSDVQINTVQEGPGGELVQYAANSGDARIWGVDMDLILRLTEAFSVGLAGEYVNTEMVSIFNAQSASHAVGDPLDEIPENHVSAWAAYDFQWFGREDGYVRLDYAHQGESQIISRTVGPWFRSSSDVLDVIDATIGWRGGRFNVDLFGQNLTNDRGYVSADSRDQVAPRLRPRTYGIKLMLNFE